MIDFVMRLEPLTEDLLAEMSPLLEAHWSEVAHYPDIPLDVDEAAYLEAERLGVVRCYTVREASAVQVFGRLLGYAVFIVKTNLHYRGSLQALQDVLFIEQRSRGGVGGQFIAWCDEQLQGEGVQVVMHHVKAKASLNFGPLLARLGYDLVDEVWAKRLDAGYVSEHAQAVRAHMKAVCG